VSGWDRECAACIDLDIESSHGRLITRRSCRDRLGLRHLALDLSEAKVGDYKGASRSPPSLTASSRHVAVGNKPSPDQLGEVAQNGLIRCPDRTGDLSNRWPVVVVRHLGKVFELTLPTSRPIGHSATSQRVAHYRTSVRMSQPGRQTAHQALHL